MIFFLLWTKLGAKYICMEPWCGCQDFVDTDYGFKNKKGIIKLLGREEKLKCIRLFF